MSEVSFTIHEKCLAYPDFLHAYKILFGRITAFLVFHHSLNIIIHCITSSQECLNEFQASKLGNGSTELTFCPSSTCHM